MQVKIIQYYNKLFLGLIYKALIRLNRNRLTFTFNYLVNIWGNPESKSGEGSTLHYTKSVRTELPILIKQMEIRTLLDIPCGDFAWMQEVIVKNEIDIKYTGVDIVAGMIKKNNIQYSSDKITFQRANAISYTYSAFDMVLVRDFLFHISFRDMHNFIGNFLLSDSKYLLTSSYTNRERSIDIHNGDFREINLLNAPFYFSNPVLKIKDYVMPYPERYLYLFGKDEVEKAFKMQLSKGVNN
jgi:hypothetical protein